MQDIYREVEKICLYNSNRILSAFIANKVEFSDFTDRNGYNHHDTGREKLEKIFASVLGTEDALVRVQIMSGTNALYLAFSALLKYGDTMISISGKPYDSLLEMVGLIGNSTQSLKANGIKYEQIDLIDNQFDVEKSKPDWPDTMSDSWPFKDQGLFLPQFLTIAQIEAIIKEIRSVNDEVIVMVDNCYGNWWNEKNRDTSEPTSSWIIDEKSRGGIATSGGYIAGRAEYIGMIADRLTAPGIGKDLGANFNQNSHFFKGIFLAPNAVKSALKTQIFASYMLEKLGFTDVSPKYNEYRTDIIQLIQLKTKKNLLAFARSIQASSPVDSNVYITPSPMPGYPCDVIMAAGCFVEGSTIELSADAPCVEPYTLYMQGGLTYEYGKLSIMNALSRIVENK